MPVSSNAPGRPSSPKTSSTSASPLIASRLLLRRDPAISQRGGHSSSLQSAMSAEESWNHGKSPTHSANTAGREFSGLGVLGRLAGYQDVIPYLSSLEIRKATRCI